MSGVWGYYCIFYAQKCDLTEFTEVANAQYVLERGGQLVAHTGTFKMALTKTPVTAMLIGAGLYEYENTRIAPWSVSLR